MKSYSCQSKKSMNELKLMAEFLKVISEENRLKILCLLQDGQKCVCEIWQYLNLPQNLTSHHLSVLKDFGLISAKKQGLKVIYSVNKEFTKKNFLLLNKIFPPHAIGRSS